METQPTISLIIVNYRSAGALRACLESLEVDNSNVAIEYIVVNNDPSESEALSELGKRFPIRIITTSENIGFGAASNLGAEATRADILGFLNPDTRLIDGSLDDIISVFRAREEIGVVGATLVDAEGYPEHWSAGRTATLGSILGNHIGLSNGRMKRSDTPTPTGFVSGAAFFIRKSLFENLGGFDERFFLYFEDMDLCLRARNRGLEVIRLPKPVFVHDGGASQLSRDEQKRHYYASQDIYFEKHRPKWEGFLVKIFKNWFVR